jgi:hypothetical protein
MTCTYVYICRKFITEFLATREKTPLRSRPVRFRHRHYVVARLIVGALILIIRDIRMIGKRMDDMELWP